MGQLARADVDRFVERLSGRLPCPVRLVLTGGGEAMLLGGTRATADLDFAVVVAPSHRTHWPAIERALAAVQDELGIALQYSDDIDRWSSVSIPVTRRRTRPFRRMGRLSVHLLEPTCWAVYKLARYLDSDVDDLRAVTRRQGISWRRLARLCGEALRASPRSTQLRLFRQQVEHFFRTFGSELWGKRFRPEAAIERFHRAAAIRSR